MALSGHVDDEISIVERECGRKQEIGVTKGA
jgi:hypothetical protein